MLNQIELDGFQAKRLKYSQDAAPTSKDGQTRQAQSGSSPQLDQGGDPATDQREQTGKHGLRSKINEDPEEVSTKHCTSGFKAISRSAFYKVISDPGKSEIAVIGHYRPKYDQVQTRGRSAHIRPDPKETSESYARAKAIRVH